MLSFLRYYCKLRLDVLLGRYSAARPLGIRYRWQVWKYQRHVERARDKGWTDGT